MSNNKGNLNKYIQLQIDLQKLCVEKAGVNITTCGNCGGVLLHHKNSHDVLFCYNCGMFMEKSDCPDLYYEGMSITGGFIPEPIKDYRNRQHECIFCRSENIEGNTECEVDDRHEWQNMKCLDCGSEWIKESNMTFFENQLKGEK